VSPPIGAHTVGMKNRCEIKCFVTEAASAVSSGRQDASSSKKSRSLCNRAPAQTRFEAGSCKVKCNQVVSCTQLHADQEPTNAVRARQQS
jgi:hypothetical protein